MASDKIRAAAAAMTPAERLARFHALKEVVARQGGILLDPAQTEELVALGELLGISVQWRRVELPNYSQSKQ